MTHMSQNDALEIPEVTLGLRLHMAMSKAKLSRKDMARLVHKSEATITRWTSDRGEPGPLELERWAQVCRVPLPWLAGKLFADPTVEPAAVPHPRRRATDIKPDSPKSSGQYTAASLACQVRSAHDLLLATT